MTPKKLHNLYKQEWNWFRTRILKVFLITFLVLLVVWAAYFFYNINQPEKALSRYLEIQKDIPQHTSTGLSLAFRIFFNNTRVSFFSIASGLLPLMFLPMIHMVKLCSFLGLMSSVAHMNGDNVLSVVASHVLPHGIIELPAAAYSYCLGIAMCFRISKKLLSGFNPFPWKSKESPLFGEKQQTEEPLSSFIFHCFKNWLLIIMPLVFIAALIEALITARNFG